MRFFIIGLIAIVLCVLAYLYLYEGVDGGLRDIPSAETPAR
jgi:hypothetical protein